MVFFDLQQLPARKTKEKLETEGPLEKGRFTRGAYSAGLAGFWHAYLGDKFTWQGGRAEKLSAAAPWHLISLLIGGWRFLALLHLFPLQVHTLQLLDHFF